MKKDYCSLVPDSWFGIDISGACKVHDEHYAYQNVSRKEADVQFRYNIQAIAPGHFGIWLISWIYYFGVRVFGGLWGW